MAKLKIIKIGDDTLRQKSRPVTEVTPRIRTLLDDMLDTMHAADGCGLAGPQVGVLRRVIVVEAESGHPYQMVNPEILEQTGTQNEVEGCLSVPGEWGKVVRPAYVKVRYLDKNGQEQIVEGTGLLARALCHEIDHLNGILFVDNATELESES